jgi:hypothetical protein
MANKQRKNTSATGKHQQQRQEARKNRPNSSQNQRNRRKRVAPNRTPWLLLGGAVVLIAAIIVFFVYLSNQSSSTSSSNPTSTPVDTTTLKEVTSVDSGFLSTIGTGGVANPFSKIQNASPILNGPTGKPEVFYYGAEFCPNCAAERWSIVVAMSRFGTFKTLAESTSSSTDSYPNTSTFTFYKSSYTSSYIDFVPLENEDQQQNILQTPTTDQQQILTHYTVSGFPFMDIGDRYILTGASYDPATLRSNPQDQNSSPLSHQDIAAQLSTTNQLSKDILGTANYLTAATCAITNNQPATVCSDSAIQTIETSLTSAKQSSVHTGGSSLATLGESSVADIWRRWNAL